MYKGTDIKNLLELEMDSFIKNDCTACGGAWVSMIFTGIKRRFYEYWLEIPENKQYDILQAYVMAKTLILEDIYNKLYLW